jgi:hypothetical protein
MHPSTNAPAPDAPKPSFKEHARAALTSDWLNGIDADLAYLLFKGVGL